MFQLMENGQSGLILAPVLPPVAKAQKNKLGIVQIQHHLGQEKIALDPPKEVNDAKL